MMNKKELRPTETGLQNGGVYCWTIERSMFRHPDSLPTVFKAIGATLLVVWLLMSIIALCSGDWDFLWSVTKMVLLILTPIFCVLTLLGYLVVAMMYGGKYRVVFEMSEEMIVHRQVNRSTKDSDFTGWMSLIAGTMMLTGHASGGAVMAFRGLHANSKVVMKVGYKDVGRIEVMPGSHTIRLWVKKWKYDIWTKSENFAYVRDYLIAHCQKARVASL